MIKKVSKRAPVLTRTELGNVKGGARPCVCDCDSPGCSDWISQGIAIIGAAASTIVPEV